jgi:BTB/POZ domain
MSLSSNKREGSHDDDGEATGKMPRKNEELLEDDELPEESVKDLLKWRTEDSFADWKIVVTVENNVQGEKDDDVISNSQSKESIYNVRKCILADGPRRSEYFVRLFEGNFSEARDNTCCIELNELQAKAFPDLLDYIYSTCQRTTFT